VKEVRQIARGRIGRRLRYALKVADLGRVEDLIEWSTRSFDNEEYDMRSMIDNPFSQPQLNPSGPPLRRFVMIPGEAKRNFRRANARATEAAMDNAATYASMQH
jgi:hypothetical protein